jgi:hypothetical protein
VRCFVCEKNVEVYVKIHIEPGPYYKQRIRERRAYVRRSEFPVCLDCLLKNPEKVKTRVKGQIVLS